MNEKFDIAEIEAVYPSAVITTEEGKEIDYKALVVLMAMEISDIKDQLNEKDYQVTRIFERLERLAEMV